MHKCRLSHSPIDNLNVHRIYPVFFSEITRIQSLNTNNSKYSNICLVDFFSTDKQKLLFLHTQQILSSHDKYFIIQEATLESNINECQR